jgi:hypothetical protein
VTPLPAHPPDRKPRTLSSSHRHSSGINPAASVMPRRLFSKSAADLRKAWKPVSPPVRPSKHSSLVMLNSTSKCPVRSAVDFGHVLEI